MDSVAIKLAAAALVNRWIERAGIQKQQAAARVELDYHGFYRAYLDPNRRLNQVPDRTVMLIRAFTVSCTEQERCTAAEALRFCTLAQLPLHRYNELRELFPANEWNQAIATYAPMLLPEAKATPLHSAEPRVAVSAPHCLPFARNPLFGGRDEELQALAELFRHDAPQTTAICGMGGVGKSELANAFAHRYAELFPGGVFWISCADPDAIGWEVARCGGAGLCERDDWDRLPFEEQVRLVRRCWQSPEVRLLVFDECEDEAMLRQWRPTTGGCHVLVTSRRARWSPTLGVQVLALRELRRAESVALLCRYRPDLSERSAVLHALAARLGDLPLALHLVGSYLATYRYDAPFDDPGYLLAELQDDALLEHQALCGVGAAPSTTNHELHVARTFARGLARLDQMQPLDAYAYRLLLRLGQCEQAETVPRAWLAQMQGIAPGDAGAVQQLALGLQRLEALGFVRCDAKMVSMHCLMVAFVRRLGGAEQEQTLKMLELSA